VEISGQIPSTSDGFRNWTLNSSSGSAVLPADLSRSNRAALFRAPKRARISQEVFELLSACVANKKPEDMVITRDDGSPVGDFRKAWRKLCISVGLGRMLCRTCGKVATESKCECGSLDLKYDGLLVHDLRRTSVRNLGRLGFAEKTIMEISGTRRRTFCGVTTSLTSPAWQRLWKRWIAKECSSSWKKRHSYVTIQLLAFKCHNPTARELELLESSRLTQTGA
jgi:hypothetical protein